MQIKNTIKYHHKSIRMAKIKDTNIKSDFILGGSKITADGDCSHEIKTGLLLGMRVMTNLDSIFKSRDILCRLRSD